MGKLIRNGIEYDGDIMEYIETDNLFTTSPNPDFVVIDIQPVLYIGGDIVTDNDNDV